MTHATHRIGAVSAVIPCYRCEGTIRRALNSIWAQTLRPAEVILVDDGVGEKSVAALHDIAAAFEENWITVIALEKNSGPATARNRGWDAASQPFVAFLDADDAWHPRKIEIQLAFMQTHPDAALSAHQSLQLTGAETPPPDPYDEVPPALPVTRRSLLLSNRFVTPSVMVRRETPLRFLENRRHMEDHLLWLRMACHGFRLFRIPLPLVYTYKAAYADSGLSSQMWPMALGDLANYRQLRAEGLLGASLAWPLYAFSVAKSLRRFALAATHRFAPAARHP